MKILSLDPSLRAFGWAVIEGTDFIAGGCIVTKSQKQVSDADTAALKYIAAELKAIINSHGCEKVVFENPVGSKSSRANQSLSYVKGLVIGLCTALGLEHEPVRAKTVKKTLTENKDATKEEILVKVKEKFSSFDKKTEHLPKFKLYAVSDAAAVYLSLLEI